MSLFDAATRDLIEITIDECDFLVCKELQNGVIQREISATDYLTRSIRQSLIQSSNLQVKLYSQELPLFYEQKWGVDAVIILFDHDLQKGKICLFEAKVDRKGWDKISKNSATTVSHFSSQLARQVSPWNDGCVIWEQFYKKSTTSSAASARHATSSTCILHSEAVNHHGPHPNTTVWGIRDIELLAFTRFLSNQSVSMGSMVKEACECNLGKPMDLDEMLQFIKDMPPMRNLLLIEKSGPEFINIIGETLENTHEVKAVEDRIKMRPRG